MYYSFNQKPQNNVIEMSFNKFNQIDSIKNN